MNVKLPLVALLPQKRVLIWAILKDFEFADYCLIIGELERFYGGPQLSRQNQKPHGKNKIPHGKTKNLTAKTKYLTAKPKTSRQQILHSKNQIPHGKSKYPRQNQSYFAFAVKYLVLPWGFGFAVTVVSHHSTISNTKRIYNSFWGNLPTIAKQMPSKVLFVGKKTRSLTVVWSFARFQWIIAGYKVERFHMTSRLSYCCSRQ